MAKALGKYFGNYLKNKPSAEELRLREIEKTELELEKLKKAGTSKSADDGETVAKKHAAIKSDYP